MSPKALRAVNPTRLADMLALLRKKVVRGPLPLERPCSHARWQRFSKMSLVKFGTYPVDSAFKPCK